MSIIYIKTLEEKNEYILLSSIWLTKEQKEKILQHQLNRLTSRFNCRKKQIEDSMEYWRNS